MFLKLLLLDTGIVALYPQDCLSSFLVGQKVGVQRAVREEQVY